MLLNETLPADLAIETCVDVADDLVADRRLRVPETGAETFEVLAEAPRAELASLAFPPADAELIRMLTGQRY